MNVCTYGYSLDFIPWETDPTDTKVQSWVKHIDWMALQGINLPLVWSIYVIPRMSYILFTLTCTPFWGVARRVPCMFPHARGDVFLRSTSIVTPLPLPLPPPPHLIANPFTDHYTAYVTRHTDCTLRRPLLDKNTFGPKYLQAITCTSIRSATSTESIHFFVPIQHRRMHEVFYFYVT